MLIYVKKVEMFVVVSLHLDTRLLSTIKLLLGNTVC